MALNATTHALWQGLINPPVEVSGEDLYKGVDASHLNILERGWMNWYIWWGNPIIATGVMSFLLHELLYFGRAAPWVVIDSIPALRRYKIQQDKVPSWKDQWDCTKYVLLSHFTVELPQIWGFHPMCQYLGLATYEVPFPSIWTVVWQLAIFFVFEDTWHYWAHRLFHWGPFYRHIHKKHHEYAAPFGLAAEYAHPLETLILGTGTIGGPLGLAALKGQVHLFTVYTWIIFRLTQAIDSHSGYDFPWSLRHILPFWAGADHHDYHHQAFVGCYASSFRWWDYMMDTEGAYHQARQNQKEMRRLMEQGMDRAQAKKIAYKRE